MRGIGINQLLNKEFDVYEFADAWYASFNSPEKNFKALVYGLPGNGKTEFCIKWAKYLTQFGKVYYNSFEQGVSKSLQDAATRNNLKEVSGKMIFGNKETLEEMTDRLSRRNSPKIIFIDSLDYMNFTDGQYKQLTERFPKKAFIIICWEKSQKPQSNYAKKIEYMVDVKIRVQNFKAYPRCRFGGNVPYVIWNKPKAKPERNLFNP